MCHFVTSLWLDVFNLQDTSQRPEEEEEEPAAGPAKPPLWVGARGVLPSAMDMAGFSSLEINVSCQILPKRLPLIFQ